MLSVRTERFLPERSNTKELVSFRCLGLPPQFTLPEKSFYGQAVAGRQVVRCLGASLLFAWTVGPGACHETGVGNQVRFLQGSAFLAGGLHREQAAAVCTQGPEDPLYTGVSVTTLITSPAIPSSRVYVIIRSSVYSKIRRLPCQISHIVSVQAGTVQVLFQLFLSSGKNGKAQRSFLINTAVEPPPSLVFLPKYSAVWACCCCSEE